MNKPDTKFVYDKPTPWLPMGSKVFRFDRPNCRVVEGTIVGAVYEQDEDGFVDADKYSVDWEDQEQIEKGLSIRDLYITPQQAIDKEIIRVQGSINLNLTQVQIDTMNRTKLEEMRKRYTKEDNNVD